MKEKILNALPFFMLLIGLAVTGLFYRNTIQNSKLKQKALFNELTIRTQQAITGRLQSYVDEQMAAAAFVLSSDYVSRNEWSRFVAALALEENYPGVYGLGLAVPVQKSDSAKFLQEMRREIRPDFKLTSLGQTPQASDLFVIKFIDPLENNLKALGFDMGSEPKRRFAMEKARDSGKPTLSRKIVLVQDRSQTPGFLIYVPVYKPVADSAAKKQFIGWSYAPIIARNFMEGVLKYELSKASNFFEIELYDGDKADPTNLLYKSWIDKPADQEMAYQQTLPLYNNRWTLRIIPTQKFQTADNRSYVFFVLVGGILFSLLLFYLLRTITSTRRKAIVLAGKMTAELRTLNQDLDRQVAERTQELDAKNQQLNRYAEKLKNDNEDLELKVKFRNLELEKKVRALEAEIEKLKSDKG